MRKDWRFGVLTGLLLAVAPGLLAQTTPPAPTPGTAPVLTYAEQMPTFKGGRNDSIMAYIRHNTRYPAAAIQAGASGKVFVTFVINAQGQMEQLGVVKPVHPALDQEALRVIQAMPAAWQPARQAGKPVAVAMTLPISFVMQAPPSNAATGTEARYPGGPEALLAYLAAAPYPAAARATNADVRLFIKFKISKEGKVSDAKPIGPLMRKPSATPPRPATSAENQAVEQAATQYIQAMPAWTPTIVDGQAVESAPVILPIVFSPNPPASATIYPYADQMPVFVGPTGKTDIQASIQRAAKYPALALRNQMQGTVYLYFIVNEAGGLEKPQIVGSAGSYLDETVMAAALSQPAAATPALLQGKPVKVFYIIPFTFRIK